MAAVLLDHGVSASDVVAVQLPNSVELAVTVLAVVRIGAIVTPFPVQFKRYELGQLTPLAAASMFVTSVDRAAVAREIGRGDRSRMGRGTGDGHRGRREARRPPRRAFRQPQRLRDDLLDVGDRGDAQGVPRCHYDWNAVGWTCADAVGLGPSDVVLNPFPMVNMAGIGGVFMPWLRTGFALIQHHPFDLPVYLSQVSAERVTYTLAPPALLTMLLHEPEVLGQFDISSLTRIGSGVRAVAAAHGARVAGRSSGSPSSTSSGRTRESLSFPILRRCLTLMTGPGISLVPTLLGLPGRGRSAGLRSSCSRMTVSK